MSALFLENVNIIVSRPQAQSECLAKKLSALGATVDIIPALEIHPLSHHTFLSQPSFDYGIVTSVHAVTYGLEFINPTQKTIWIAVGPATAAAIQAQIAQPVLLPQAYNSEGVLALSELQNVQQKKILILTGKAGRSIMQQTLMAREAQVTIAEVYERRWPLAAKHSLQMSLKKNKVTYLFVTSNQILEHFFSMLSSLEQAILLKLRLIVASKRIGLYAQSLGFKKVIISADASDSAMIIALKTEVED